MRSFRIAVSCLVISGAVAGCSQKDDTQVATTGSSSQALTSVNVYHSQQSGGGAKGFVQYQDSQSYFWGSFDAWENKSAKSRTAGLSFWGSGATLQQVCYDEQICSSWSWDPNFGWQCGGWETVHYCYQEFSKSYYVYGYGDIPTGDFRVGAHTAHLTTDLSQDTAFTAIQCSFDNWWTYSCSPITGTIDLTWRDNGMFSTDQNGVMSMQSTSPYSQYSTHTTGHQSTTSADVSGSFLGYTVASQGDITLSMDTMISKDVFKGPQPPPPGDGGAPPPPPPPADGGTD